jgi:hypothetical protein
MRSTPPDGGLKFVRLVSIRPDVHCPEPFLIGVIFRLPAPSRAMFWVLVV